MMIPEYLLYVRSQVPDGQRIQSDLPSGMSSLLIPSEIVNEVAAASGVATSRTTSQSSPTVTAMTNDSSSRSVTSYHVVVSVWVCIVIRFSRS